MMLRLSHISRLLLLFITFLLIAGASYAQPKSREELEKQRQQLKKEIEETQQLLNQNKSKTKENLLQFNLISKKVVLQDKVIDNISKDLRMLNDTIYITNRDIYRYDKLLDTLRQEYANSMIYAYKNRSNYDILNFVFSAKSFNDAMRRITYLKSYRTYRAMQGQEILYTQELRRNKIEDLKQITQKKAQVRKLQQEALTQLQTERDEKDRILAELKKQSKVLNSQIAAKKKQMQKVTMSIAAAIKEAQRKAREEQIAKMNAEKKRLADLDKQNKTAADPPKTNTKPAATRPEMKSILLNDENIALNNNFERNKGSLPWPCDKGYVLMHYGKNTLPSGSVMDITCTSISTDAGSPVKAVFDGTVSTVFQVDNMYVVLIQHGRYFTTYSNLTNVSVQKGQQIKTGQQLGRVGTNMDGLGAIDFYIQNESRNYNPEDWLRRR
jgi:septal ring factor EnvC (AmiA/AmiB activator)